MPPHGNTGAPLGQDGVQSGVDDRQRRAGRFRGLGAACEALGLAIPAVTLGVLAVAVVEVVGRRIGDRDEERMRRHLKDLFKT